MQQNRRNQKIRLQKVLASATHLSRRSAEEAITGGRIQVNGVTVTKLGTKVDAFHDRVTYNGKPIRPVRQKVYVAFNKPANTIVSKKDPEGRKLIWDLLPQEFKGVLNSAGRLDFDSEGIIILSNDGVFINHLTHPSHDIWKTYHVKVIGTPTPEEIIRLKEGVMLSDGKTAPARAEVIRSSEKYAWLEISIHEGRQHQIKRMCAKTGHPVLKLKRVAIGPVRLGQVKNGKWRFLKAWEVDELKKVRPSSLRIQ